MKQTEREECWDSKVRESVLLLLGRPGYVIKIVEIAREGDQYLYEEAIKHQDNPMDYAFWQMWVCEMELHVKKVVSKTGWPAAFYLLHFASLVQQQQK